jgi:hypothetical protein
MKALGFQVNMQIEPVTQGPLNTDDVRDALCDIMVFALGAFHRMGIDAEADMDAVLDGVMTRFCKDGNDLLKTRALYDALDITYTVHGEYPRVYLRSDKDQKMPDYPKGKFLKSASYSGPVFAPLPTEQPVADPGPSAPVVPAAVQPAGRKFMSPALAVQEMTTQRESTMSRQKEWLAWQSEAIKAYIQELATLSERQQDVLLSGQFVVEHVINRKE